MRTEEEAMRHQWHENIKYCPKCGVASLGRDWSHQAEPKLGGGGMAGHKQVRNGTEWVCATCGFAFLIRKSTRVYLSEALQKETRKLRNSVTFDEQCISPEVVAAFQSEFHNKNESGVIEQIRNFASNILRRKAEKR